MERLCGDCNISKPIERFSKDCKKCKDCKAEYQKKWRENNPEKNKEHLKKWYDSKGKDWKKEYDFLNKDHTNQRDREKYKNDPIFRNKKILKTRLLTTINGTKIYNKILDKMHMKHDIFLKWLEFQFSDDITWENQGAYWGIDHVIPIDYFIKNNLNEDEDQIHHWSNLRPCKNKGSDGNFSKNNKIDKLLIKDHFSTTVPSFAKNNKLELDDIVQRLQRKWVGED
jgi:hypothetical protein